jgi:tetratricopeptide (TPR) repeat protein
MMENMASANELKEEGLRLFGEGLHEEAIAAFERAGKEFANEGNEVESAVMVNNLGVVYRMQGRWDEAIAALEQSRVEFDRLGDRNRQAQALGNLGGLYASKRDREQAKECLRQAAQLFAESDDAQRQGETLLALGVQEWKTGDRSSGLATYESGLHLLERPTVSQRLLRGLLSLLNSLLGIRG